MRPHSWGKNKKVYDDVYSATCTRCGVTCLFLHSRSDHPEWDDPGPAPEDCDEGLAYMVLNS